MPTIFSQLCIIFAPPSSVSQFVYVLFVPFRGISTLGFVSLSHQWSVDFSTSTGVFFSSTMLEALTPFQMSLFLDFLLGLSMAH